MAPKTKAPAGPLSVLVPNHFFLHSGLSAFYFFEQSSILPPPWLPAMEGMDANMKADAIAASRNFMIYLC